MLKFGGCVKVRESLHAQVLIRVTTLLNYIDTTTVFPRYEGYYMVYTPNWYQKQKTSSNVHTRLASKNVNPQYIPEFYNRKENTKPTLVDSLTKESY
jgi:hypothetical protein